jgi:hypothetical protein
MIIFTKHASDKFKELERHKFSISRKDVLDTLREPDLIDKSRLPLLIAQKTIDSKHVLRVVFKKERDIIKVITFYPGRIKQYET